MKLPRRQFLRLSAGAAAIPAVSRIAAAQTYTTRPTTMIVPFAAGGTTDVIGRVLAARMRDSLKPGPVYGASARCIVTLRALDNC
jgi:tripartite-type tricarboxylate transporter receptor subunit TctC